MRSGWVTLAIPCAAALLHCTSVPGLCDQPGACAEGDAATDGGGAPDANAGPPIVVPGCDLAADIADSPACLDERVGLFVDAARGKDDNVGSRAAPLKSITAALAKREGRPRVYVCEGTYPEALVLSASNSAALTGLFGGFRCAADWQPGGAPTVVAPTAPGYALELANLAAPLVVADITFRAQPGTSAKRSSVAVFARDARAVLRRVTAEAGAGADGAPASLTPNFDASLMPDDPKLLGKGASGTTGGAEQACNALCTNGERSTGGKGGAGSTTPSAGEPGKPDRGAGLGGLANTCSPNLQNGNAGLAGTDAAAASVVGLLEDDGWKPSDGAAGKAGGPGQGGGGGGGKASASNGAGGGGGCGGCGGAGASLAQGGGASIALLSLRSSIELASSTLRAAKAGSGGAGAAGQAGQIGGFGGTPSAGGCQGGEGGAGGRGGASAGGAGGISVAVVSKGTRPTLSTSTLTPGTKGTKGTGGAPGTNDGPDGVQADSLDLP
jgi:hypothetical protein